jgi:hypothetical protein
MNGTRQVDDITRALSRHLRINPLACDTLEGISQWWGPNTFADRQQLALALRRLQEAGVLEEVHAADGRVRYRRVALSAIVDAQLDRFISGESMSGESIPGGSPSP